MKRLPRWLGSLLSPADDPRGPGGSLAVRAEAEALLAELRRSRGELAQLREVLRNADSPLGAELVQEEEALLEAERNLLASIDERRAVAALLRARRRATEAELLADL